MRVASPIYPRIHSGGDRVVQEVYPDGLYTPEDYASIAQSFLN